MHEESLFGIWNPTENTLKKIQALYDVLAKNEELLELEIYTLQNEQIQSQYAFDVLTLLNHDWQEQPLSGLSIAFLRPTPIYTVYFPEESGAMPIHSTKHIAVAYLGIIDNLSEIQEKLFSYGYQFNPKKVAETLSCLFYSYLKTGYVSPIEAMQVVMSTLKGHFAIMVLVAKGNWLMVGCSNYPLGVGKEEPDDPTVYFGTDTDTLALFSPSIIPISGKPKPTIFCVTLSRSDMIVPIPL